MKIISVRRHYVVSNAGTGALIRKTAVQLIPKEEIQEVKLLVEIAGFFFFPSKSPRSFGVDVWEMNGCTG